MKLISLTCPNCNANLDNIDPNLKQCYCQYCGTKIALDDGTIKQETHIYDEARIKENESAERVKMRELDIEQERKNKKDILLKWLIIALAILFIVTIILCILDILAGWLLLLIYVCIGIGIGSTYLDNNKKK